MRPKFLLHCLLAAWYCFAATDAQSQTQVTIVKKQRVILIETFFSHDSGRASFTTAISYSGKRGSTFRPYHFYSWKRDGGYNFSYDPTSYPIADLPEPMQDVNKMDVQYDSVHYVFPHLIRPEDRKKIALSASYNHQNQITAHYAFEWGGQNGVYGGIFARDSNGRLLEIYMTVGDTAAVAYDTISRREIVYDKQQRVVSDTLKDPSPLGIDLVFAYEYDNNGHASSVTELYTKKGAFYEYRSRQNYTRHPSGRLEKYIYEMYSAGSQHWDLKANASYNYDGKGRLTSWQYDTDPGDPGTYSLHYNNAELADTLTISYANGNAEKNIFFYNEFMNPDSAYTYNYSDTAPSLKQVTIIKYHYELYDDTIITPVPKGPLVLYPNPAGSKVTIRWNAVKPGGPVYAILYSVAGQLVRRVYISSIADENSISISGLASGVYHLRIMTQGGGMLHTESLVINNNEQ
jgi:hypothetical protein